MNGKNLMKLAASSLLLGTAMVSTQSLAGATAQEVSKAARAAAQANASAERALGGRDAAKAVRFAEQAVAAVPTDTRYRTTLGQAYLLSGRFTSAATAFSEAVALDPTNSRAAVSLSLAQTALARNNEAIATLDAIHSPVAVADLGLARALAGDTRGAINLLSTAARAPDATSKTRQNLALSFALAGKWQEARTVAAQDIAPDQLDQRIIEWAKFTQAKGSWDQVASLLGVTPARDAGEPAALALARPVSEPIQSAAIAAPMVVASATPVTIVAPAATPVDVVALPSAPVPVAVAPSRLPALGYATSKPMKSAGIAVVRAPQGPVKTALIEPTGVHRAEAYPTVAKTTSPVTAKRSAPIRSAAIAPVVSPVRQDALVRQGKGNFVVQLGAFSNAENVAIAWKKARGSVSQLSGYSPSRANFTNASATLYRLSVGGFETRAQATKLCEAIQARGGQCFVRAAAGDAPVQWVSRDKPTRVAARKPAPGQPKNQQARLMDIDRPTRIASR